MSNLTCICYVGCHGQGCEPACPVCYSVSMNDNDKAQRIRGVIGHNAAMQLFVGKALKGKLPQSEIEQLKSDMLAELMNDPSYDDYMKAYKKVFKGETT